jgi:Cu/Ag efflux pump CusA
MVATEKASAKKSWMAVVILGGLLTSTLLNLFIVPSLYLRFGGRRQESPTPTAAAAG